MVLSLCAQMHTNKHMYRDKNTCMCVHALTCSCSRNSLNILLLASVNRPSSFPQHEHTAIKAIPALKLKPCKLFEVMFWSFKMGETTIRGEWPLLLEKVKLEGSRCSDRLNLLGGSVVCVRFSVPPVWCQSLLQRQHICFTGDKRALNTFWLPGQNQWSSKGHMHKDICTQRCKDTHQRDEKSKHLCPT